MSNTGLKSAVVVQFVVICALSVLLYEANRPKLAPSRVPTVLADIRGVLSVGANYTQFQEKVQSLSAAIEEYNSEGGSGPALKGFEESLKLYKDSLDLWTEMINLPNTYASETRRPSTLLRIAREQGFEITSGVSNKVQADVLMQELWAKADEGRHGKKNENGSGPKTTPQNRQP
jgi:hypothetical protein